jgi:hypothetical protein
MKENEPIFWGMIRSRTLYSVPENFSELPLKDIFLWDVEYGSGLLLS